MVATQTRRPDVPPRGASIVRLPSVYLDTPDLRSYHGAGRGRRLRFKVRGRGYLDVGETWLEVKTRAARGVTVTVRVPHDDVERAPLSGLGRDDQDVAIELRPGP